MLDGLVVSLRNSCVGVDRDHYELTLTSGTHLVYNLTQAGFLSHQTSTTACSVFHHLPQQDGAPLKREFKPPIASQHPRVSLPIFLLS
jgi:hypothetical protein